VKNFPAAMQAGCEAQIDSDVPATISNFLESLPPIPACILENFCPAS
jgi:hypothetical protein